jgi:hypothetical protein
MMKNMNLSADPDGDYTESFERNLRDAVGFIFEEFGLGNCRKMTFETRMWTVDEDDLTDIYEDKFENGIKQHRVDLDAYENEDDQEDEDAD